MGTFVIEAGVIGAGHLVITVGVLHAAVERLISGQLHGAEVQRAGVHGTLIAVFTVRLRVTALLLFDSDVHTVPVHAEIVGAEVTVITGEL